MYRFCNLSIPQLFLVLPATTTPTRLHMAKMLSGLFWTSSTLNCLSHGKGTFQFSYHFFIVPLSKAKRCHLKLSRVSATPRVPLIGMDLCRTEQFFFFILILNITNNNITFYHTKFLITILHYRDDTMGCEKIMTTP